MDDSINDILNGVHGQVEIANPTLRHAKKLVPAEYLFAYDWFQRMAGRCIELLPFGPGTPEGSPIPLARQAGIYCPGEDQHLYFPRRRYALSIHEGLSGKYENGNLTPLPDGSWRYEYHAQEGKERGQKFNEALLNCLLDGIPVGIILAEKEGSQKERYRVMGLAFIEKFDQETKLFRFHGPVNVDTESKGLFMNPALLSPLEEKAPSFDAQIDQFSEEGQPRLAEVNEIIREGQGRFRQTLLNAYDGKCAITDTGISAVLQAAHIIPYRIAPSQNARSGILLRADIHLLYDSHLLSVMPETHIVCLSNVLSGSCYHELAGRRMRLPTNPSFHPSEQGLEIQFHSFETYNRDSGTFRSAD